MTHITLGTVSQFPTIQTIEDNTSVDISKMSSKEMIQALQKPNTPLAQRANILLAIAKTGEDGNRTAIEAQIDILTNSKLRRIAKECAEHLITNAVQADISNQDPTGSDSNLLKLPAYIFSFGVSDTNNSSNIRNILTQLSIHESDRINECENKLVSGSSGTDIFISNIMELIGRLEKERYNILKNISNGENIPIDQIRPLIIDGQLIDNIHYMAYLECEAQLNNEYQYLNNIRLKIMEFSNKIEMQMLTHKEILEKCTRISHVLQDRSGNGILTELRESIGISQELRRDDSRQVESRQKPEEEEKRDD